jgi:hypothetical protein
VVSICAGGQQSIAGSYFSVHNMLACYGDLVVSSMHASVGAVVAIVEAS